MLINCLHHPLFHDASRMRAVDVDISSGCLILESHARPRCRAFRVLMIAKVCQRLSVSSYVKSFGFFLNRSTNFSFEPIIILLGRKGTIFSTSYQMFQKNFFVQPMTVMTDDSFQKREKKRVSIIYLYIYINI